MSLVVGLLNLPCLMARRSLSYFEGAPPLGLAYVAAAARAAGHDVRVVDALGEAVDHYTPFSCSEGGLLIQGYTIDQIVTRLPDDLDVLGIGNLFLHEVRFLQELLPRIRERFPRLPIFLGGENASGMWEDLLDVLPEISGCVLGEGEEAFVRLLEVLERGEGLDRAPSLGYRDGGAPRRTAAVGRIRAVDDIPLPAWDLFPVDRYLAAGIMSGVNQGASLPLLTSRGCPFSCAFCSAPSMWGSTYVSRTPERLLDEIELLMRRYRVTNFDFRDLTTALTKPWIRAFHAEVKRRGVRFTWQIPQGTRSEQLDREALELLYETGLRNFGYALESVSQPIIVRMRKKVKPARLLGSLREALRLPLRIEVFFIIGYPGETRATHLTYASTIARLAIMGVHAISLIPFNPYPGSEDYARYRRDGALALDDAYVYSSLLRTVRQHAAARTRFSNRYIVSYSLTCLLLFYGLQFLLRPWRLLRSASNLARQRQETIFDQFLAVKTRQWVRLRDKWTALAATAMVLLE